MAFVPFISWNRTLNFEMWEIGEFGLLNSMSHWFFCMHIHVNFTHFEKKKYVVIVKKMLYVIVSVYTFVLVIARGMKSM